jgi:hypothetical protein
VRLEIPDWTETGRKSVMWQSYTDSKSFIAIDPRSAKPLFVGSTPIRASNIRLHPSIMDGPHYSALRKFAKSCFSCSVYLFP